MKIRTLTLGEYGSPPTPFCLYLFPTPLTPPLTSPPFSTDKDSHFHFLCLEDLDTLFFVDNHDTIINNERKSRRLLATLFEQHPAWFCKDQSTGRSYLMTQAVAHIASQLQIDSLVNLCRLTEDELFGGKAIELLRHHTMLDTSSLLSPTTSPLSSSPRRGILNEQEFVPTRLLDGHERFDSTTDDVTMAPIKEEPQSPMILLSPPSVNDSIPYDPCRDDVADNRNRLSSMPHSSPPTTTTVVSSTSTPTHENNVNNSDNVMTDPHLQLPKPSSLLLKRSAGQQHHKAPTNLTIFTPSYANGTDATSIRSAPLRPRSKQNGNSNNTGSHLLQQRHPSNTQHRIVKPNTVKKHQQRPPATAAPWQRQGVPQTEFPSPPIVPSQQRCPPPYLRTATFPKTPMTTVHHPPPPHHHHPQVPATAAVIMPPRTTMSKKQQFLQPFEMLYDNIEQSRQLKTTLDDQIRRSSSLMQTLQSSSTMVEALVRRHVRDAMQQQLQEYSHRVEWLEKRMLKSNRRQQQQQSSRQSSSSVNETIGEQEQHDDRTMTASPPLPSSSSITTTTTSSGSNGNNQQMGHVLSELLDRLDRLETKIDSKH
ncbi:hypothetical protein BDC45DRAFT_499680 [Circinella umbellata]|nr:hypothetical protein BDC45DRAFT_499680 [Circinella umbellata]